MALDFLRPPFVRKIGDVGGLCNPTNPVVVRCCLAELHNPGSDALQNETKNLYITLEISRELRFLYWNQAGKQLLAISNGVTDISLVG